ncbi:MAG TPA: phosphoribosylglycinamide formyltransferase [Actinomycetota bacterium]|nr:phosphoribosylglycinamide formyltransferase [Actinomycetota bacterium]
MSGRIVVLISGTGSNMSALVAACEEGSVPGEVVLVAADRACTGLEAAERVGIETLLLEPKGFASRDEWGDALRDEIVSRRPDLVVSAGFMRILPPRFIDAFDDRLINLHPSLLPAFPGAHGVRDALEAGVKETGSTIHFVDYEVDHGPIIAQEAVAIVPGDTVESLHEKIKEVEHRLLPAVCKMLLLGRVHMEGGRVTIDDGR